MTIGLKAANAGKALLTDQALTNVTNYYAEVEDTDAAEGNSANNRTLPCVICYATNIQQYPTGTLLSNLNLHIKVVGSADDLTATQFDALFSEVHDTFNTASVCANLSAVQSSFHAFGFWDDIRETDQTLEGRNRVKELILPINCAPHDVS